MLTSLYRGTNFRSYSRQTISDPGDRDEYLNISSLRIDGLSSTYVIKRYKKRSMK